MSTSFANDIRPLFMPEDIQDMLWRFDLSLYNDVLQNADLILRRLERGDMPCYAPWPSEQVDLFRSWISDGMKP